MQEKFHLFCGVTHKDTDVLDRLCCTGVKSVVFRATGTSQDSLPSDEEMHAIQKACPCLVFPGGIKRGLGGPKESIELKNFLEGKMASVIYVDKGSKLFWAANEIDMRGEKVVEIEVNGTELSLVRHFTSEVVGSDF